MPKKIRYFDRNKEPFLSPEERVKTFKEYALGFSVNMAVDEAKRCLFCKDAEKRCIKGCPIHVDIPGFIKKITEGDLVGAYKKIIETDIFPSICGRVCPQERQCEGSCILYYDTVRNRKNKGLPVSIGALEKFVGDFIRISGIEIEEIPDPPTGKRVAIIGAGPAGLGCAYDLAMKGHKVYVYEALPKIGGVMTYGIPSARLSKEIIDYEYERFKKLGVEFIFGCVVGRSKSLREIINEYDAVFIASGYGRGRLGLKGDDLENVYSAIEVLMRVNLFGERVDLGKKTVIIGGGFTAIDAAITALRLGVETHVVYRRTRETSSARQEEWDHIKEEGAFIHWLTQPVEILGEEGKVRGIKCIKMTLGEKDESGRPRPVPVPNSEHIIDCDSVIFAIGQDPNPVSYEDVPEIKRDKWGGIMVNERYETTLEGVFAGGDVISGGDTVVKALAQGREAAKFIHEYLMGTK